MEPRALAEVDVPPLRRAGNAGDDSSVNNQAQGPIELSGGPTLPQSRGWCRVRAPLGVGQPGIAALTIQFIEEAMNAIQY